MASSSNPETTAVPVPLGPRHYDIHIGAGLLSRSGALVAPLAPSGRVIIVVDNKLTDTHLPPLRASLIQAGLNVATIPIHADEENKTFNALEHLLDQLLEKRIDRKTLILAVGGGVVGDVVGFAASIILRGVPFVQVPTTLLSQVDSSVGGKTGVNTRYGKNLIGSFSQPKRVLIDADTLRTLPRRQIMAGYAEILKYALIGDPAFFMWLCENGRQVIDLNEKFLNHSIATSCAAKAGVVTRDEFETGERALLNLGHTFGHAIEAVAGYDNTVLHGEAVALGCLMAFDLSVRLGLCEVADLEAVRAHQQALGFPLTLPALAAKPWDAADLLARMDNDKKAAAGQKTFVLVRGIGQAFLKRDVPDTMVSTTLEAFL